MDFQTQNNQPQAGNYGWQTPVMQNSPGAKKAGPSGSDTLVLQQKIKRGANWFYWIAALSLLNSILWHAGAQITFIVGLGMTQLADGFVLAASGGEVPASMTVIAITISALLSGVFALFGMLSRKHYMAAFVAGTIFYGLDAPLFVVVGDWLGLGFHVFAMIYIISGAQALSQYHKAKAARRSAKAAPVAPRQEWVRQ